MNGYTLFYFAQTFWLRRILEADFISLRPGSLGARGVNASLPPPLLQRSRRTGLDGRHAPWLRLRGMCSFSLWTRHYRKYKLVNRQRLARVGGAPTETVNVRLSPFESVKAPHQTLMHTQSAFQYWGAQVIGHTFGCA